MFKRYDLDVYYSGIHLYSASFSSINHLVKFACGFDSKYCDIEAFDTVFENTLPIYELMKEFRGDVNGIWS